MNMVQEYTVTASDLFFGAFLLLIAFGICWWGVTTAIDEAISFYNDWVADRRIAREREGKYPPM